MLIILTSSSVLELTSRVCQVVNISVCSLSVDLNWANDAEGYFTMITTCLAQQETDILSDIFTENKRNIQIAYKNINVVSSRRFSEKLGH